MSNIIKNPFELIKIRKESGSSEQQSIQLLIVTWNMKGKYLEGNVQELLDEQIETLNPDIIVIGTQECLRSLLVSVCCSSKKQWETFLKGCLSPKYFLINSHTMNAMNLCIFATSQLASDIFESRKSSIATGFCGCIGNKGGIAIYLQIRNQKFLFINCHLPSGQQHVENRRADFETIMNRIGSTMGKNVVEANDFVFWCGDFNSRIAVDSIGQVERRLENQDHIHLLKKDQLLMDRMKNPHVYQDFREGLILFTPTYKLESNYNEFSHQQLRIPGWTDRILFYAKIQQNAQLLNYRSAHYVFGSDHRPVVGEFLVSLENNE